MQTICIIIAIYMKKKIKCCSYRFRKYGKTPCPKLFNNKNVNLVAVCDLQQNIANEFATQYNIQAIQT